MKFLLDLRVPGVPGSWSQQLAVRGWAILGYNDINVPDTGGTEKKRRSERSQVLKSEG